VADPGRTADGVRLMICLSWEAHIAASADTVFALLSDLRGYDTWLPRSPAFHGTDDISEGPIREGTRYVEPGPLGTRFGVVTRIEAPCRLDFEQPMVLRPRFLGRIGIRLFHTIAGREGIIHLTRRLELVPEGPIRFVRPFVVRSFVRENERMMAVLKQTAENRA
jgi:hypothetical protein